MAVNGDVCCVSMYVRACWERRSAPSGPGNFVVGGIGGIFCCMLVVKLSYLMAIVVCRYSTQSLLSMSATPNGVHVLNSVVLCLNALTDDYFYPSLLQHWHSKQLNTDVSHKRGVCCGQREGEGKEEKTISLEQ